ncbi:hypothetical protein CBR_g29950 [Chara braunii]|uniref:Ricin B lectin domain-containing protein n=1 Tax=Chara braunii TaxID=69332 RepID=A0A388LBI2_CHABU|nr:hypothetical protein CBR_g29950 [Chara braunii]|eukprot:GBG79685.1 hypothetical protein CBR_g29950 [Chara braunii]
MAYGDSNPYFNIKDWGLSRGDGNFGGGEDAPPIASYSALFYLQVECDPQYVLSISKEDTNGPLMVMANQNNPSQTWRKVDFGTSFALVNVDTGRALLINGEDEPLTTSSADTLSGSNGIPSVKNLLRAGDHRREGYTPITTVQNKYLHISLADRTAANGVKVVVSKWRLVHHHHQSWRMIPAFPTFTLRPKLDIAYGLSTEKDNTRGGVTINKVNRSGLRSDDPFLTWYLIPVTPKRLRMIPTKFKIVNSASGFALRRVGSRKQIEQVDPSTAGEDAVWTIGEDAGGCFFPLHPATANAESADVNGSTAHAACIVRTVEYGRGDDQIWGFFPIHSDTPVNPRRS